MSSYRYVILDPTGNLTGLVLDPVEEEKEKLVTRELLRQCEQVAYLERSAAGDSVASIRLMGGEFCGNAAMAAAAWLVRNELEPGKELPMLLDVSGTKEPVPCRIRKTDSGVEGTVQMPGFPAVSRATISGFPLIKVRLEGITHLIYEGKKLGKEKAECLIRQIAGQLRDEAVGLLQWNRETREMLPLVWVRNSESLVWEHGCGSGSAAVGAYETLRSTGKELVIPVRQPGGTIRVTAAAEGGKITSLSITGIVRLGTENRIQIG